VFKDALQILPHAVRVFKKPAALGYTLATAYRAQLALVISLVLLIFVAPSVVDSVTRVLFPPETAKKVFGLITTQEANPLKAVADTAILASLWLVATMSTFLLAWFYIPRGEARVNARAERLLVTGDSCNDPVAKRKLYGRALSLTTDTDLASKLEARLREITSSEVSAPQTKTEVFATLSDRAYAESHTSLGKDAEPSQSGSAFDERYRLGNELGKGAMGVVFQARDTVLDRKVAVKQLSLILSSDEEHASRFRREAKALARLAHPNVVQVYDLIERGSRLWMVLEYVDGGDLAAHLDARGPLTVAETVKIAIPIAEGLAYAHDQGIIHRDLKPANILLTRDQIPKISDFGIARLSQSSNLTQVGAVLGSPPYMSPEQCSGDVTDTRTDIYALGITLYEMLSGEVPFHGDTASVLARQIVEAPRPLTELSETVAPEAEELVLRMLAKDPNDRPHDMREVIRVLRQLEKHSSVPASTVSGKNPV
jgi:predicted Ser/Thr protein kinase